jgi:hypothetical protein
VIVIDGTEVKAFADQLRAFPRELRPELRREIKRASDVLVGDIRSNASWSSRIPSATKVKVGFGARSSGVQIHVDAGAAPHARPLEFGNNGGFNRHPVFGGPAWVNQPVRPFFMPAVRSNERQVIDAVGAAIAAAFARL